MSKLQKAYSFFFSLCLAGTLLFLPGQFFFFPGLEMRDAMDFSFFSGNVYRLLPLYSYLEQQSVKPPLNEDTDTSERIIETNRKELEKQKTAISAEKDMPEEIPTSGIESDKQRFSDDSLSKTESGQVYSENQKITNEPDPGDYQAVFAALPKAEIAADHLLDYEYLINHFYIVDENTETNAGQINAIRFLGEDLSIKKDFKNPQILIYHTHSQESFADSREGEPEDTVIGVGNYLAKLLTEQYGYQVLHVTDTFDLFDGELDRNRAYDAARESIQQILQETPSIEVIIDLHRDGVPEDRHLVTSINGKDTAQILFYNGLSYTRSQGAVSYLPNPYIQQNLAFSFQLDYQSEQYFPGFSRGIYLAGLRYNLHLCPRALLLEAGAQTNTIQEVKNAMEPFAGLLNQVLSGH